MDTVTVPSREEYLSDWDGGLQARIDGGTPRSPHPSRILTFGLGDGSWKGPAGEGSGGRDFYHGLVEGRQVLWVRQPFKQRKE